MSKYTPTPPPLNSNPVRWVADELNKAGVALSQQFDNEPVWTRVVVDGHSIVPHPTSGKPDFSEIAGAIHLYKFDGANNEEAHFSVFLNHNWKEGSTIIPIVRWTCATATTAATVIWGLEHVYANTGSVFTSNATVSGTSVVSTALKVYETTLGTIQATTNLMNVSLACRVFRKAATDTYTEDVGVLGIDFLVQVDGVGTPKKASKT